MGKLDDWTKDIWRGAGDALNSFRAGSKKIARKLGYGSVVKSLNPKPPGPPPAIPLPDEENIARIRRRRAAQRGGGRDSTQLTSDNQTFGP